ncbi:hypothetical protein QYM36_003585 [Artemia franciscana]|uniref:Lipase domain-containing protein n=1 Tax=Artemia franciscana TaxID=6661 RepID=A0AA88I4A0_ARTSF|nr:hypothetical protein QYM36_003585 [Artemia franciscana]
MYPQHNYGYTNMKATQQYVAQIQNQAKRALRYVPDVGYIVADFIRYLVQLQNVDFSSIHLIGHSLGAHVAGVASATVRSYNIPGVGFNNISRITDINGEWSLSKSPSVSVSVLVTNEFQRLDTSMQYKKFGVLLPGRFQLLDCSYYGALQERKLDLENLWHHVLHCGGISRFHARIPLAQKLMALDPAVLLVSFKPEEKRLTSDDAAFIDVIHSNGMYSRYYPSLGMYASVGHADFYPNGGAIQPGCKKQYPILPSNGKCDNNRKASMGIRTLPGWAIPDPANARVPSASLRVPFLRVFSKTQMLL